MSEHWDSIFSKKDDSQLGWYEENVDQTMQFFRELPDLELATVFLPGAGTSVLVEELINRCGKLVLNDISEVALDKLKSRLGNVAGDKVQWFHHDISFLYPEGFPEIDLWIDRAVLHFLLKEEEISTYFENLQKYVKPGGHVLLAEFSTEGVPRCAGLDLHLYSVDEMSNRLGQEFQLIRSENHIYVNPFGESRPYIYALFHKMQKNKEK